MQPLQGMLVLDFSTLLPGPMASLLLAEAGAEVVKIERPHTGEDMRAYPPKWGRDSVNFAMLNRGKKSLALDLKSAADLDRLAPLLARADIVIEQFRPGVMTRLGLDYTAVAKINPRIIYCSITGYGQTGPKRDTAGHDLNYIGDAGLLALSMGTQETPIVPPALIADIAGGTYPAVLNILLALQERTQTGLGRHLDIAMTDNLFAFSYWAIGSGQVTGTWPGSGCSLVTGGSPRYRLYPAKDGRMVAVAAIEQKFWETFCALIELDPALQLDTVDPKATVQRIGELIRQEASDYWRGRFKGVDCCCSVVADLQEAMADPAFSARGLFDHTLVNEAGAKIVALPVPIDPAFRAPPHAARAPTLGHHNAQYLT
jgi:alpha-methylacyl-CoA racemase